MYYDIIIVGAGLAGLYSAYNIKKMNPHLSFLILERDQKKWVGGRIGTDEFYGEKIVVGAGIGREKKDKLLVQLLKELHIPTKKCDIKMHFASTVSNPVDVVKIIQYLKKEYESYKTKPSITFSQFAKEKLGESLYKSFTISAGYTDYENEDVFDTLYYYGMDDNHPGWKSLIIDWSELVDKLCKNIGWDHIRTKHNVDKIQEKKIQGHSSIFEVTTVQKQIYTCTKVIIAGNINTIHKLLPGFSIYNQIHGQPFLRVYAKVGHASDVILRKYIPSQTIVPGPLHKLIPIGNGVYMIAYTDNAGALALKNNITNTSENRIFFARLLEQSLGIASGSISLTAIKSYYWPVGTHYYSPLKGYATRKEFIEKAQHPMHNMFVVGEMVSLNQGWTEGALESVKRGLKWLHI